MRSVLFIRALLIAFSVVNFSCKRENRYDRGFIENYYQPILPQGFQFLIQNEDMVTIPDTIDTQVVRSVPYMGSPLLIFADEDKIGVMSPFRKPFRLDFYNMNGISLARTELKLEDSVYYALTMTRGTDTTFLCSFLSPGMGRLGVLFGASGIVLKRFILPFDIRLIDAFMIQNNYLFVIGFEQLDDTVGVQFNWVGQCYSVDSLIPIDSFGAYPVRLWYDWADRVPVGVAAPLQLISDGNDIWGVFTYFPVLFRHTIRSGKEEYWHIKIDNFEIPNIPDVMDTKLEKVLLKTKWSLQYYANWLNDSLMIVFREHIPPYYIDVYNTKPKIPIYLGAIKVEKPWQPVCSYKDKIILLNRENLLKNRRITLKFMHITT